MVAYYSAADEAADLATADYWEARSHVCPACGAGGPTLGTDLPCDCPPPEEMSDAELMDHIRDWQRRSAELPDPDPPVDVAAAASQGGPVADVTLSRVRDFLATWWKIEALRREASRLSVGGGSTAHESRRVGEEIHALEAETATRFGVIAEDIRSAGRVLSTLTDGKQVVPTSAAAPAPSWQDRPMPCGDDRRHHLRIPSHYCNACRVVL